MHKRMSGGPDQAERLRRETRLVDRPVPETIGDAPLQVGQYRLFNGEFLLRGEGFACHYRPGEGLAVRLDDPRQADELDLFVHGTVHAAIAALNGLYALHASAVAVEGRVVGFSGPSGAGKSTLAAALDARGFPLYCDDTLVIDPGGDPVPCLPGHKRLKLWPEGLALAGVAGIGQVSAAYPKQFAAVGRGRVDRMLPLAALVFLEDGDRLELEPVGGGERMALFDNDHYTASLHALAAGMDRAARFAFQARLARTIPVWRLRRPFDPAQFGRMIDLVADRMRELAGAA